MLDVAGPQLVDAAVNGERRPREAWGRYAEVLGLTLVVPLFGYLAHVPDPFFVHAAFPWLAVVAVLIGAQHGVVPALLGAALSSAGAWAHAIGTHGDVEGLRTWSVGCLFVALITGWFRDQAHARQRRVVARAAAAEAGLQQLSRTQRVLQLSHTRLEERLVAEGWSLENVVRQASRELGRASTRGHVYGVLLDVLGSQAQLQAVSLFVSPPSGGREGAGRARLEPTPVASLGKAREGAALGLVAQHSVAQHSVVQHPVVQRVLATGKVAMLAPERVAAGQADAVLGALPLVTSAGRWLGVIVVQEMPFIAFSPETFSELLAIAERLADLVEARLVALEGGLPAALPLPLPRANAELVSLQDRMVPARARPSPSGVRLKLEEAGSLGGRAKAATVRRRGGQS
jgi:hypothetical protein